MTNSTNPEAVYRPPESERLESVIAMVAGPGGTVFVDPSLEDALRGGVAGIPQQLIEQRAPMYAAGLRVLARMRRESRQMYLEAHRGDPTNVGAEYDPARWNTEWQEEWLTPR